MATNGQSQADKNRAFWAEKRALAAQKRLDAANAKATPESDDEIVRLMSATILPDTEAGQYVRGARERVAARRGVDPASLGPNYVPPEPVDEVPAELVQQEPAKPPSQQSRAVQARWAGEQASETDLREYFLSLPLTKAFNLYAKMRQNLETAGKILNDRSNVQEIQRCKTCNKSLGELGSNAKRGWFLDRPHYRNGDRNIIDVDHFCSAACISLENNKTQGVYGMQDRGMLPQDNPKNHPRQFPKGDRS